MIPSVYVAGASKELDRCKHWIGRLRDVGIKVTHDWTVAVEAFGSCGDKVELTVDQKKAYARADLLGIQSADVVWLLAPGPEATSVGMWVELGYALASVVHREVNGIWRAISKRVVVSPAISDRCIFAALPQVQEFASDAEAFEYIERFGGIS